MSYLDCIRAVSEERRDLAEDEFLPVMGDILDGDVTLAQAGALLGALHTKGEAPSEIAAAVRVLLRKSRSLESSRRPVADITDLGTRAPHYDVAVAAALLTAAAGGAAVKHGNPSESGGRSVHGKIVSADVLSALGLNIHVPRQAMAAGLGKYGFAFALSRTYCPALTPMAAVRRDLGVRSIFNLAAPLANPAIPEVRVLGVDEPALAQTMAAVLRRGGALRGYIVCGADGLGLAAAHGPSQVILFEQNQQQSFEFFPADYGFKPGKAGDVAPGDSIDDNAAIVRGVLDGNDRGARRDAAVINAGFALHALGTAATLEEALELAAATIEAGRAARLLGQLQAFYAGAKES